MNIPIEYTIERTQQDIKALGDSVSVINNLCSISLNADQRKFLKANVDHISYMLSKEHIISDTGNKSAFTAAVEAGTAKLA
jgi:hypothetical protein